MTSDNYEVQLVSKNTASSFLVNTQVDLNPDVPPPPITYYWTVLLILDHSYLHGNLTNSKITGTRALEPLKC